MPAGPRRAGRSENFVVWTPRGVPGATDKANRQREVWIVWAVLLRWGGPGKHIESSLRFLHSHLPRQPCCEGVGADPGAGGVSA